MASRKRKSSAAAECMDDSDGQSGFPSSASMQLPAAVNSLPAIKPMSQFLKDYSYTQLDTTCEHAIAKLAVAKAELSDKTAKRMRSSLDPSGNAKFGAVLSEHKKDLSVVGSRMLHYDESQREPVELEILRKAQGKLIRPDYTCGTQIHTHAESSHLLRSRNLSLPLLTAKTESALMASAGRWYFHGLGWREFDPCCYGKECIGMLGLIDGFNGARVVLRRAMTETQYAHFTRTGEKPTNANWPCVLCGRMYTTQYVQQQRLGVRPKHEIVVEEPSHVYQLWRNLFDQPCGYQKQFMLMPEANEILVDPIPSIHLAYLRAHFHEGLAMWTISQDAMVWREAPILDSFLGESISNFCRGADSASRHSEGSVAIPAIPASKRASPTAAVCSNTGSQASRMPPPFSLTC